MWWLLTAILCSSLQSFQWFQWFRSVFALRVMPLTAGLHSLWANITSRPTIRHISWLWWQSKSMPVSVCGHKTHIQYNLFDWVSIYSNFRYIMLFIGSICAFSKSLDGFASIARALASPPNLMGITTSFIQQFVFGWVARLLPPLESNNAILQMQGNRHLFDCTHLYIKERKRRKNIYFLDESESRSPSPLTGPHTERRALSSEHGLMQLISHRDGQAGDSEKAIKEIAFSMLD